MLEQIKIGRFNDMAVVKRVDFGVYLDGGEWGEILLPARYVPSPCVMGDVLSVFVYFDSEDRIIATRETPAAQVGQCAYLRVVDVNAAGAFLDWGLPKDLHVPYVEQNRKMRKGAFYVVAIYQDEESERITASAKLGKFLDNTPPPYTREQTVRGMVMAKTDLGYKVIIEHTHTGLLYDNEIFTSLNIGQAIEVVVAKIREDGKIDLRLPQPPKDDLSVLENEILQRLRANHGQLALGDKTPPETVYQVLGVSKKNFKRALSRLYKQRLILVEAQRITLTDNASDNLLSNHK